MTRFRAFSSVGCRRLVAGAVVLGCLSACAGEDIPWYGKLWHGTKAVFSKGEKEVPAPPPRERDGKYLIDEVQVDDAAGLLASIPRGPAPLLTRSNLLKELKGEAEGQYFSITDVGALCKKYNQILQDEQFVLAKVTPVAKAMDLAHGKFALQVSTATYGEMRFFQHPRKPLVWNPISGTFYTQWFQNRIDPEKTVPYHGVFYSEAQLRRYMSGQPGVPFNYNGFYRDAFGLNSMPDLQVDGNLKVASADGGKVVNTDFVVTEDLPLHMSLSLENDGTEETDIWRAKSTIQYMNLTHAFDVLTIDLGSTLDYSYRWVAGSYYYPLPFDWDTSLTLYGSRTWLDVDEIQASVDAQNDGWMYGTQLSTQLLPLRDHSLNLTLGLAHRYSRNATIIGDTEFADKVTYCPFSVGIDYHNNKTDFLQGRNFASVSWYANREGWLASDDDDEFALVRAGATADFDVCRYRLARLQKVGWGEMPRWLLYLKAEGQYTGSPLVPTEQFAVGGMRSVRGYNERETVGDKGILLSAELRTPLLNHGNFQNWFNVLQDEVMNLVMSTPRPNEREEVRQTAADTIQFLLFCDYGHVTRIAPGAGEFTNADLCSVGAGIRLSLWNRLQMRVDYGVPLHNSPDELEDAATELSGNGALHVGLTLQF